MAIKRLYDTLVGATVRVNQLIRTRAGSDVTVSPKNGIDITIKADGSIILNGTATADFWLASASSLLPLVIMENTAGHILLFKYTSTHSFVNRQIGTSNSGYNVYANNAVLVKRLSTASVENAPMQIQIVANDTFSNDIVYPCMYDLTAYFGSTIADYLYNLETATAGAGIAKLKEWGFLTGKYIPYNAGTLESVEARSHVMRGFNQWDEEWEVGRINDSTGEIYNSGTQIRSKNFIPCLPNIQYFLKYDLSGNNARIAYYDADKNYLNMTAWVYSGVFTIPNGARYMKFFMAPAYGTTYNHNICINLSNPDRNGEYEPYSAHTYDLGTDTLRGLFKLDAENRLYADGDRKASDGTVTRYYGTRAYQEGDESLADAITDGANTVYKLTTPITEQSTPFTNPQICDPDGTEEYVTNNGVPVGHETRYQL